ncbi:hypothetical protein P5V15_001614 [Pogonomyrmex californicus]
MEVECEIAYSDGSGAGTAELDWYKIYRPEAGKACGRLTSIEIPAAVIIMSYKIIVHFIALLAVVRAGIVGSGATAITVAQQPAATIIRAENYDPPRYSFGYSVADGLTDASLQCDNKAQEETRRGDVVHGSYSLIEPDGSRRVVSYEADPISGFNAIVQRDPGITIKTAAVASAPVRTAVHPDVTPSVIAAAAPAAVAVRPQAHLLCRRLLGVGLGVRSGSVYGTQTVVANDYDGGSVVKIH